MNIFHFIEHHCNNYEKKITPKWIGSIIRRKLKVKTEKGRTNFVIPRSELEKLERLYEKYGISEDISANNGDKEESIGGYVSETDGNL